MSASPTLNPRVLGQAESAHQAILNRILDPTGITYHHWVTLKVTAVAGGVIDRGQLVDRVTDALKLEPAAVLATIAELTAALLLEDLPGDEPRVGFTETGRAHYRKISAAVDEVVGRLYVDIPEDDLATAGRVLTLVTARANAELASA